MIVVLIADVIWGAESIGLVGDRRPFEGRGHRTVQDERGILYRDRAKPLLRCLRPGLEISQHGHYVGVCIVKRDFTSGGVLGLNRGLQTRVDIPDLDNI